MHNRDAFFTQIAKITHDFPFLSALTIRIRTPEVGVFDAYTYDWTARTAAEYFVNGNILIVNAHLFDHPEFFYSDDFNSAVKMHPMQFFATHELGHAVDHYLQSHADEEYLRYYQYSDALCRGFREFSEYSAVSARECFAEMFTACYLSNALQTNEKLRAFRRAVFGMNARLK